MGTITKRKAKTGLRYRAGIHVRGRRETKTFGTKREAEHWLMLREGELQAQGSRFIEGMTIGDLINRYIYEILRTSTAKYAAQDETYLLKLMRDNPRFTSRRCERATLEDAQRVVDTMGESCSSSTVRRQWFRTAKVWKAGVRWRYFHDNPFKGVELPEDGKGRMVLITDDEVRRIREAAEMDTLVPGAPTVAQRTYLIFEIALSTAMRLGEILQLRRSWISESMVSLPDEAVKNNTGRVVPLPPVALRALEMMPEAGDRYFRLTNHRASHDFIDLRRKAGIEHIRFHDSRHRAITDLSNVIRSPWRLAKIVGHKDLKQTLRYYKTEPLEALDEISGAGFRDTSDW